MDNRAGLIIGSTDQACFVYIGLYFSRDSLLSSLVLFSSWLLNWELYYLYYHWTLCLVVATTSMEFPVQTTLPYIHLVPGPCYVVSSVVATTYHNDKWSHKQVNLKSGYNVGSSQENLTRSLFLIRVLFIQSPHGLCY